MKDIVISTENIKLDSFLKFAGEAQSGGEAKKMINSKKVLVNGEICTSRGKKLVSGNSISVEKSDEKSMEKNEYRVVYE